MSWKLIDRPKTAKVTKNLAKSFMEMEPAPHDRPLSERRLQVYAKLLAAGQFRPVTWASAICKETGEVYRVNGKHTSTLLAGLTQMPDFFVTVEEYECDTLEDVGRLYATFDSKMMSRTANDIYLSFAATCKEIADLPVRVITNAAAGIAYADLGQDVYGKTQPAERAEYLLEHTDFVQWLAAIFGGGPTLGEQGVRSLGHTKAGHLYRQPIVAAMFKSWSKHRSDATKFWEAVRDATGTKPNLPDRVLSTFLLTSNIKRQGEWASNARRRQTTSTREVFVKCLHAWNAWRKGESTKLNYYAEAKVPSVM